MIWYEPLYLSDNLSGTTAYVQWLTKKKWQIRPMYVIVLSLREDAQLEILPVATLDRSLFYPQEETVVVGVAKGYYHARAVVEHIYQDVLKETESLHVKDYFRNKLQGKDTTC